MNNRHRYVKVAVTGHRPAGLTPDQRQFARSELNRLAVKLRDEHGTRVAISGLALGADTWWAQAAEQAGLTLWAYVPFPQQADQFPTADRAEWVRLRRVACRVVTVGDRYDVRLFHARNDLIVQDCDLLIVVHDPARSTGGTVSTLRKARNVGRPLVLVDVAAGRTCIEPGPRSGVEGRLYVPPGAAHRG